MLSGKRGCSARLGGMVLLPLFRIGFLISAPTAKIVTNQ
jgi:hypothetical protein